MIPMVPHPPPDFAQFALGFGRVYNSLPCLLLLPKNVSKRLQAVRLVTLPFVAKEFA